MRAKVFPALMSRAMWWFRWSALITVVSGLRYFWILLAADARNAGNPALAWQWMGWWLLVWLVAFALIYPFQMPRTGILDSAWVRTIAISAIAIAASLAALETECECGFVERASVDQRRRRIGIADAAQHVGSDLARAKTADRVDAGECRARARRCRPKRRGWRGGRFSRHARDSGCRCRCCFFMAAAEHYPFLSGIAK